MHLFTCNKAERRGKISICSSLHGSCTVEQQQFLQNADFILFIKSSFCKWSLLQRGKSLLRYSFLGSYAQEVEHFYVEKNAGATSVVFSNLFSLEMSCRCSSLHKWSRAMLKSLPILLVCSAEAVLLCADAMYSSALWLEDV